jgi:hypothetical protein
VGVPAITIASGWYIGIEQTDGTRFWTTVSGSPSGTTCTLTSGLSVGAAAGATVFSYQTKLIKPLRVLDGFTRQIEGNDVPHLMISREQYNRFGMKSSAGTSIQAYYDSQRDSGNYYVYPTTQDVSNLIYIEFQKPFDDMSGSTQNMDVPQEWIEAIKWGLAMRLAPEYGVPKEKLSFIKGMADQALALVDGWDQEPTSLLLQPDQWAYTPGYTGSNK